jgi:uncharacterized repeat protein (TIGR04076 family)
MDYPAGCINYKSLKIRVSRITGNCRFNKHINDEYSPEQICPENICPVLYHSAIPYLLTFLNNGRFAWLRDRNSVIIQCPNSGVSVTMNIKKNSNGKRRIDMEVIETQGPCPFGIKKGDSFKLNERDLKFCPKALDALFPYLNALKVREEICTAEDAKQSVKVACPGHPDNVIFEIISI